MQEILSFRGYMEFYGKCVSLGFLYCNWKNKRVKKVQGKKYTNKVLVLKAIKHCLEGYYTHCGSYRIPKQQWKLRKLYCGTAELAYVWEKGCRLIRCINVWMQRVWFSCKCAWIMLAFCSPFKFAKMQFEWWCFSFGF